jgi:hypothetical protein
MRQHASILSAIAPLISIAWTGCAATISKTEDSLPIDYTLAGSGTVTLPAYGFGRSENATATEIPLVGFVPCTNLAAGPSCASTTYVQQVAPDRQTVVANSVDILRGAAAGSLCNSPTLAIVANVDADCTLMVDVHGYLTAQ